jgi:hypothetical protein
MVSPPRTPIRGELNAAVHCGMGAPQRSVGRVGGTASPRRRGRSEPPLRSGSRSAFGCPLTPFRPGAAALSGSDIEVSLPGRATHRPIQPRRHGGQHPKRTFRGRSRTPPTPARLTTLFNVLVPVHPAAREDARRLRTGGCRGPGGREPSNAVAGEVVGESRRHHPPSQ